MSDNDRSEVLFDGDARSLPAPSRDTGATETLDVVFHALANRRRRYLLYCLSTLSDAVVERETLVEAVRAYEAAADTETPSRQSVALDLHNVQLPSLEEAGVIEYDHRRGTVHTLEAPWLKEWTTLARYKELAEPL